MRVARLGLALICTGLAIACGNNSEKNPTSPTAPGGTAEAGAAADGSTLKATAPAPASPKDGVRVDSRRPALTFSNAVGKFQSGTFTYRVEVFEGTTSVGAFTQAQASGNQSTYTLESDLKYDTVYRWRVRGEMGGAFTAWSALAEFRTPAAPIGRRRRWRRDRHGRRESLDRLARGVRDHPRGAQRRAVESRLRIGARGSCRVPVARGRHHPLRASHAGTRRVAILTGA